jgi:hypothetical protein
MKNASHYREWWGPGWNTCIKNKQRQDTAQIKKFNESKNNKAFLIKNKIIFSVAKATWKKFRYI